MKAKDKKIVRFARNETINGGSAYHTGTGPSLKIIALSIEKYLMGALQGFCHIAGCLFKSVSCNNTFDFIEILIKEEPSVVFVNTKQVVKMIYSSEWKDIKFILKEKNILLCGIGETATVRNNLSRIPSFNKTFEEPVRVQEVLEFVRTSMATVSDRRKIQRRQEERRARIDRRKQSIRIMETQDPIKIRPCKKEYVLRAGTLSIDHDLMSITVDGRDVEVSPKEFQLLDFFVQNIGHVVKAEEIIKVIWPDNTRATKADVHQCIYMLRHKLEKNPHKPEFLITIKGFGYKMC